MNLRWIIAALSLIALSCGRPESGTGQLNIALIPGPDATPHVIQVNGLSSAELRALRGAALTDQAWQAVLRIGVVGNDAAPVSGRYVVTDGALEFHPRFPFDRGQEYQVRFDPAKLPAPRRADVLERTILIPAPDLKPSTVVTGITPSAATWPENLLRFYVHFSAPMSRTGAIGFVSLLDENGRKLPDVFLEANADLWNSDDTRFTVLFDPGRVKRGILPNLKMGRAVQDRGRYTIVIDPAWRDAAGQPLKQGYRREVRIDPPIDRALRVNDWELAAPKAGSSDPLRVTFPWALDQGLLHRAIGVSTAGGQAIAGAITTEAGETRWVFTPRAPWRAGAYQLVILTLLEDPSGNAVGRAFETAPGTTTGSSEPERVMIPFVIW